MIEEKITDSLRITKTKTKKESGPNGLSIIMNWHLLQGKNHSPSIQLSFMPHQYEQLVDTSVKIEA